MISITDLLTDNRIPGNYFASDAYVQGDLELGLLENRRGERLLALPEMLLQGIYAGLEKETGQASRLVLYNCGRWWGKNFYARFCEELTDYYQTPMADMPMVEFIQCLEQCWVTHGWGRIKIDHSYQDRGFLVVTITNSPFTKQAPKGDQPVGFLEAGALCSFFSQLTGRELHCVQTTCESMGADSNRFVLGLPKRLEPAETMVTNLDHDAIMQQLCQL
ncbi:MAG: 4-vinyl reductase [Synechococcales cyanobacterium K44_A2020_017]|jgi:predicted hydrocarbon binding protein|uniref:V4R domain-containing protein n=1 Tax=Leptolyngbya sp. CCY15150 TaxID=2767772 RepID=UPI00194FED23|nr:V4R domain-containing protein [Leptolyngbya sp. CCY15150]MBF2087938.1 4-vinyl reductase [Synechococcales cyanobacterium K32_A2020_035]MBF2093743.1 4-vinyl reductase [Synechococcales cyanobacterium K44_A2020_017]